jgi:hypothetical protein
MIIDSSALYIQLVRVSGECLMCEVAKIKALMGIDGFGFPVSHNLTKNFLCYIVIVFNPEFSVDGYCKFCVKKRL